MLINPAIRAHSAHTVQTPSEKARPRHVPKTRRNVGYFKDYRKKATYILSGSFHRFVSKNWVVGVDAWCGTAVSAAASPHTSLHVWPHAIPALCICTTLARGCFRPGSVCSKGFKTKLNWLRNGRILTKILYSISKMASYGLHEYNLKILNWVCSLYSLSCRFITIPHIFSSNSHLF